MTDPHTPAHEHTEYRPNVGIVLINKDGLAWVGERHDFANSWQMPQGGIKPGEDILSAARRELLEETSIPAENAQLLAIHHDWLYYSFPNGGSKKDQFKGQKQKWFLFRYLGEDNAIDLKNAVDQEFVNWKWDSPENIAKNVVDFKRPVYEDVFHVFEKRMFAVEE